MLQIDTIDHLFSDGDSASGTKGTRVTAAWLNAVQQELVNVITGFGEALDPDKPDQLYQVLNARFSGRPGDYVFKSYAPTAQQMSAQRVLPGNGGAVLDSDYPDILDAWGGKIYGSPDATRFYLPPLCGYFPRFWDGGAGIDPGAGSRLNRGDGTTGNAIGTTQASQNLSHDHTVYVYVNNGSGGLRWVLPSQSNSNPLQPAVCDPSGGDEARPTNIYIWGGVYY